MGTESEMQLKVFYALALLSAPLFSCAPLSSSTPSAAADLGAADDAAIKLANDAKQVNSAIGELIEDMKSARNSHGKGPNIFKEFQKADHIQAADDTVKQFEKLQVRLKRPHPNAAGKVKTAEGRLINEQKAAKADLQKIEKITGSLTDSVE